MNSLEEETKDYCDKRVLVDSIADVITDFVKESKWVQSEKIKAQIGILVEYKNTYGLTSGIVLMIKNLEQQLEKIEDESKID